jgi:uncharacterized membrane protein YadS
MLLYPSRMPGILLCVAVTALAALLQAAETALAGQAYLEALVLAILFGVAIRTVWTPGPLWQPGIAFSARILLEIAVVLLGASVSARTVLALGPALLGGIVAVVAIAIVTSYGIGRALGLHQRMAILVACGNSICGNSAIAAVAPVIGADADDVASSIAFTAVLGVVVVLLLPLLVPVLLLSLCLSLFTRGLRDQAASGLTAGDRPARGLPPLHELVPWFILGFLVVLGLRSLGLIPDRLLSPIKTSAAFLTTVSMAALGLGVDVRVVAQAGARVTVAVTLSLLVLGGISLGLIRFLGVK